MASNKLPGRAAQGPRNWYSGEQGAWWGPGHGGDSCSPLVKDYEIEVSLNISVCEGDPSLEPMRAKEGPGEAPQSCDIVCDNCWGVSFLEDVIGPDKR